MSATATASESSVELVWDAQTVRIEYQWVGPATSTAPVLVFLHEGLGSVAMWKDFPERLCQAAGCRGLVYSRPGYGRSTTRQPEEAWDADFMHRQAYEVLPLLLDALGLNPEQQRIALFGHSDGASIALLYATKFPACVQSVIVLAPHIMVEDMTIDSIALARTSYQQSDLPQRLARYHDAPDSAFWAWCTIWLNPAFREWSITSELDTLSCPVLAVQGQQDEYGTLAQIHGIAQRVPQTTLLELSDCGHSPHRDQAERLIATACTFIQQNNGDST